MSAKVATNAKTGRSTIISPIKGTKRRVRAGSSSTPVIAKEADSASAAPTGKPARLIVLLQRPGGASLQALMKETGWQVHSVRGVIAGAIKKKHGLSVISRRVDGMRFYAIEVPR